MKRVLAAIVVIFLVSCGSEPKSTAPEWTKRSTRVVDNGYIVYIGTGHSPQPDRAQFKAEGQALEDLANECSMIPKGARVEDRFVEKEKYESTAYVKVALEFQECEQAKRALEPAEIRKLASTGFTEQLKKYQDLEETGEMPSSAEIAANEGGEISPPPAREAGWSDSTHFFVVRQYVAYQKEIVILSPPAAYAPNAPATRTFVSIVTPAAQQVASVEHNQPALRDQAWSRQPSRPAFSKPAALVPKAAAHHQALRPPPPPRPGKDHASKKARSKKPRRPSRAG